MTNQLDKKFVEPLDKDYNPYIARAEGRSIFNKLRTWELSVLDLKVTLTNDLGATYNLGKLTKMVKSCSLAFLHFSSPHAIIEFMDGEVVLYVIDLQEGTMTSKAVSFNNLKSVSIFYNKSFNRNGFSIAAIGTDGVYRGTLTDSTLVVKKVNDLDNPDNFRIHRFGLNTANELSIELVESKS